MHQHRRGGLFDHRSQPDTKTPRSPRTHHRRVRPRATAAPGGAGNAPPPRRGRVFEQPRHEDTLRHSFSPGLRFPLHQKIPKVCSTPSPLSPPPWHHDHTIRQARHLHRLRAGSHHITASTTQPGNSPEVNLSSLKRYQHQQHLNRPGENFFRGR